MALTLDQSQTTSHSDYVVNMLRSTTTDAQVFTAGLSGTLKEVHLWTLKAGTPTNGITVSIKAVNVGTGKPTGSDLASKVIAKEDVPNDAELTVIFSSPTTIVSGTQYAILVKFTGFGGDPINAWYLKGDASHNYYAGGKEWVSYDSESTWSENANSDFWFKTYVQSPTQQTINSSAKIKVAGIQQTINSSAKIKVEEIQPTISSDANIVPQGTLQNIDSDTTIQVLDNQQGITSNAIIKVLTQQNINSNAKIKVLNNQQTISSDAVIFHQIIEGINSDATIQGTNTQTIESDSYMVIPAEYAKEIVCDGTKIYIACDTDPVKFIVMDVSSGAPTWNTYQLDAMGETYISPKSIDVNAIMHYFYIGFGAGIIAKIKTTDILTREKLDLSTSYNIDTMVNSGGSDKLYAATNKSTYDFYILDNAIFNIFNTDLRFLKRIIKNFKTILSYIFGYSINTDLRFLQQIKSSIKNDLRYNTVPYENISAISLDDLTIKINGTIISDYIPSSVKLMFNVDEDSQTTFTLLRKHDCLDYMLPEYGGTYSQITNRNEISIFVKEEELFNGKITQLDCSGSEEQVGITAVGNEYSHDKNLITLSLPSIDEQLHLYHVLVDNIVINNPYIAPIPPAPPYYTGIKVNLGISQIESIARSESSLNDINELSPDQNYTYFWFVEGENFLTGESFFPAKYIGTSLSPATSDTFNITNVSYKKQRIFNNIYIMSRYYAHSTTPLTLTTGIKTIFTQWGLAYAAGTSIVITSSVDSEKYMEGTVISYQYNQLVVNVTAVYGDGSGIDWILELAGNLDPSFYYIGTAPYKEISTKNGEYYSKSRWEDREDGLYTVINSSYHYISWAKAVANIEYQKLQNINGTILPRTSASISVTIDAFLYYNLRLLQRINIGNTTQSGIYQNANGFPLSIKSISIDFSVLRADISVDNEWSQGELDEMDETLPIEPQEMSAVSYKIADKYDLSKQEEIT
jgi:oligoribonuclease (3'-5' exoribonuclease)